MRIFVATLQSIRREIVRIGAFGCFQSDGDETEKPSPLEFMYTFEEDPKKIWESNIFGKSLFQLVNEGLSAKLKRMPEDARMKLKDSLTRIINESSGGLICIIL